MFRPRTVSLGSIVVALGAIAAGPQPSLAADADAGRAIYSALPGNPGPGSCVSCHGDPADNRNNLLIAAGRPERIQRAMNTVSAMGFLRSYLSDAQVADVAAYLGTIVPVDGLAMLPALLPTVDFFGGQLVGTVSGPRAVRFFNRTAAPITVGGVVSTRPDVFALTSDCPPVLLAGAACTAQVRFAPVSVGDVSSLLSMIDATGATVRSATIHGMGRALLPSSLAWREGQPAFALGDVVVGDVAASSATLVNRGVDAVRLDRLRMSGPAAARFALGGTCMTGTVLAGGADCSIAVSYAPAVAGESEAWIEIVSEASNAPLVLATARAVALAAPAASSPTPSDTGGGSLGPWTLLGLLCAVAALANGPRRRN